MSDELRPCRHCGNLPETDYWRSAVWCTSSRDECPYSYLAQTPDQWQADTAREKALRADLAAWQAHSAGLAVMNEALEELVEAWENKFETYRDLVSTNGSTLEPTAFDCFCKASDRLNTARARVEELRGEKG